MPTKPRNLWPSAEWLGAIEEKTPISILHDQAKGLEELTGGLLTGRVTTITPSSPQQVAVCFDIVAPELDYSYRLLTVRYGPEPFPATISDAPGVEDRRTADTERWFEDQLREVFSSREVVSLVRDLLEMSREREESPSAEWAAAKAAEWAARAAAALACARDQEPPETD